MRVGVVKLLPSKNVRGMPQRRWLWYWPKGEKAQEARKPRRATDPDPGKHFGEQLGERLFRWVIRRSADARLNKFCREA
jgi:hypothetical protein